MSGPRWSDGTGEWPVNRPDAALATLVNASRADPYLREVVRRVEAEIARLRESLSLADAECGKQHARAVDAERREARLREGLRQAGECCSRPPGVCFDRALLAEDEV